MTYHTLRSLDERYGKRAGWFANEFYAGRLPDSACIFVGGKRAVPDSSLPIIEAVLHKAGRLEEYTEETY